MDHVVKFPNGTTIGAYTFPDRAKPMICVQKGNSITAYGYFRDEATAFLFMKELVDAMNNVREEEDGNVQVNS